MSEISGTTTVVIVAIIVGGLNAGIFYSFSCAVMPGLRRVDDRVFVTVLQSINHRIINPFFLLLFIGAPVLAIAALVMVVAGDGAGMWAAAGAVGFSLLTIVITAAVNVPLNNAMDAAGDPDRNPDLAAVRQAFETRWVRWNIARSVTSLVAFGCLVLV